METVSEMPHFNCVGKVGARCRARWSEVLKICKKVPF